MAVLKKKKFFAEIFIIASLVNFILLFLFFSLIKSDYFSADLDDHITSQTDLAEDRGNNDPFITKVKGLRDILNGPIIDGVDPQFGPNKAPITFIYFADYECHYCQQQELFLRQVMAEYKDKIRLIWKDYPAGDPDSESYLAAIAARCADEQGRFWPYQDLLYKSEGNFDKDLFIALAGRLSLKENIFTNCLKDREIAQLVENNIAEARALDIKGVPFIFINGREIMGETRIEDLRKIIEEELGKI